MLSHDTLQQKESTAHTAVSQRASSQPAPPQYSQQLLSASATLPAPIRTTALTNPEHVTRSHCRATDMALSLTSLCKLLRENLTNSRVIQLRQAAKCSRAIL